MLAIQILYKIFAPRLSSSTFFPTEFEKPFPTMLIYMKCAIFIASDYQCASRKKYNAVQTVHTYTV